MRIIKLFKNHVLALACAVALIVISCNADLALPTYMSEIVDVGIQQGGIESPAPDTICAESLSDLELFMPEDDMATVEAAYSEPDAEGIRTYVGSEADRAEDGAVSDAISLPETVVLSLEQGVDASTVADGMTGTLDMQTVRGACEAGIIPKEKLIEAASAMSDSMGSMGGSIVKQRAVTYVQQEYETQGISLTDVQNSYLASMSLKMFGLCAVSLVATILTGAVASHTACTIARDLRRQTFDRVMHFSPAEVGKFSQASLITRCTNDIQQIQMLVVMLLRMVLYAPILGIGALLKIGGSGMMWVIGLAVLCIVCIIIFLLIFAMPKFNKLQKMIDKINLVSREILTGIPVIRAFSRERHEEKRFDKANVELTKTNLFVNRTMTLMMPLMTFIMNGVSLLIIWVGADLIDGGTMQVGDLMAFIQYSMMIIMSFLMLSMTSIMLPRAWVAAKRVAAVLNTENSIREVETGKPFDETKKGTVEFRDVSFRYPNAEENVIEHISFTAGRGETTAFIGATGAGKSTLINLIPRFYDVTEGQILVDGVDVREVKLADLRDRIGLVPQKGVLFSGTIESNIAYAGNVTDGDTVRWAAKIAQADTFIGEKPDGYDSEIAQGGTNVSGGQRQRLAIARAIAKRPEIYIFDDSFSALDYATDQKLREALREVSAESTVLIVAQRISTVLNADRIIVLDGGRVAGMGTHKELMESCEEYRQIALSQLSAEEAGR